MKDTQDLNEILVAAMEDMDVAVTIIDTQGILVYYNRLAARILDRRPDYIGQDVHGHHRQPGSNQKLAAMLAGFKKGRREPFHYEAAPYGQTLCVFLAPIIIHDNWVGCIQTVYLKDQYRSPQEPTP